MCSSDLQFDIGTKKGTAEGFIGIGKDVYDAEKGYGFSDDTVIADYATKGTYIAVTDDSEPVDYACQDVAYAEKGKLEFKVDVVEAGTYTVNVYAGAFGGSTGATLSINGTDLGAIADSIKLTSSSDIVKTLEVTVEEGGQMTVICNNGSARAPLSAIVITKKVPVYASDKDNLDEEKPSGSESAGETEPTSESAGETEPTSESAGETEPTSENTSESESESESSSETEQAPAYLRFDFGAGTVEDGWTQVLAADEYSDEKGYGFVFGDGLAAAGSEKKYTSNAESLAAVADDCVLGWDATNPMEFDVKVPNGTYEEIGRAHV